MMNYEMFKEIVAERFKDYLPEGYPDCELQIGTVEKVNQTLDSVAFMPTNEQDWKMSPAVHINHLYEHYQQCGSLDEVLNHAAKSMISAMQEMPDVSSLRELDNVKDNVVLALVNTVQNKELLKNIPNRPFHDLSIIYRCIVSKDADEIRSSIINHNLAEKMGMTEADLYHVAIENTKRIFLPTVHNMNEVMVDIMVENGIPKEIVETMMEEILTDSSMYVISNALGINGAVSMLYEENLHELAESLGGNLYIMPSSRHEVIAIRVSSADPNSLAEMVNAINMTQVALEDRLSNQVYHYDKDLRKLTLATNTANKRLDGIICEHELICESGLLDNQME